MILYMIWAVSIGLALYFYLSNVYSRFDPYGVKYLKPIPIFGNMLKLLFKREHMMHNLDRLYRTYPKERFLGRYQFMDPAILLSDLELIKKVAIKDFDHFLDHNTIIDENSDPMFGRNLFSLKGSEWKDMRATLSPAFTSSKLKGMVPFIVEVGDQMTKSLEKKLQDSGHDYIDIDLKDLSTRYANDVIATCAFGLKVDSHTEESNSFYMMGKKASTFTFKQILYFFFFIAFPKLMRFSKWTLFSEDVKQFFTQLVLGSMKDREEKNIIRPDMIHLLMEAKKGKLTYDVKTTNDESAGFATVQESLVGKAKITREWTDVDLIAQALLFFIAGFETVSSAMAFLFYELALHPEVQEKLYQEIQETDAKFGGKLDHDQIQSMNYLDMVVSEILRLWPPAGALDRMCVKDYNLGKANDQATEEYIIRKGEALNIPAWSIHRDPQYYEDPLKFDPERFSEENKHKIKPFAYMPFGLGPRNCIGSRFALAEVKIMAYQLIKNMELIPGPTTRIPAKLSKSEGFNMRLEGGHSIRMRLRKKQV